MFDDVTFRSLKYGSRVLLTFCKRSITSDLLGAMNTSWVLSTLVVSPWVLVSPTDRAYNPQKALITSGRSEQVRSRPDIGPNLFWCFGFNMIATWNLKFFIQVGFRLTWWVWRFFDFLSKKKLTWSWPNLTHSDPFKADEIFYHRCAYMVGLTSFGICMVESIH